MGQPEEIWSYGESANVRARCLENLPGLSLVRRFPDEGLKVLTARVEAGQRIDLDQRLEGTRPDSVELRR
jgi:hypothetical protein